MRISIARFRIKKKHKIMELERSVVDLESRAEDLEREASDLRRENGWLKELDGTLRNRHGSAPVPISFPIHVSCPYGYKTMSWVERR